MRWLFGIAAAVLALAAAVFHPPRVAAVATPSFSAAPRPAVATRAHPRPAAARVVVYVAGEVAHPGVVTLPSSARIVDALARAGNAKPGADLVAVNLAAPVHDGDEIVVPLRGAAAPVAPHSRARSSCAPSASHRTRRSPRAHAPPPDAPLDLNTVDAATLTTLPGIGPALADRIVAYRETIGRFASTDELLDVAGITERRLNAVVPYLVVR